MLLDLFYPVDTLYMTDNQNFNPNISWGGTWVQLDGGYALTTTKADAKDGYQNLTTRADNHTPGQNMQGGLPNITGTVSSVWNCTTFDHTSTTDNKALALGGQVTVGSAGGNGWNEYLNALSIDASRCADNYGLYQSERTSVVADHHATIVWKRTA